MRAGWPVGFPGQPAGFICRVPACKKIFNGKKDKQDIVIERHPLLATLRKFPKHELSTTSDSAILAPLLPDFIN